MGLSAYLDDEDLGQVATTRGWGGLVRWARALEGAEFAPLRHLAQHGYTQRLDGLATALDRALALHPPAEPGVEAVATGLRAMVAARRPDHAILTIGDGTPAAE